jgi:hypothetical protein
MAVYQGARQRAPLPLGLEGLTAAGRAARGEVAGVRRTSTVTRGRATSTRATAGRSAATRAVGRSRPSSVGIALAVIVIVFIAAFLSLSQSVRVAATGYDIVRLVSERDRLTAIKQDLQSDVDRLRGEPANRKQALDAGLGQLGAPLHIPAR